jgi:hypothetical protein
MLLDLDIEAPSPVVTGGDRSGLTISPQCARGMKRGKKLVAGKTLPHDKLVDDN